MRNVEKAALDRQIRVHSSHKAIDIRLCAVTAMCETFSCGFSRVAVKLCVIREDGIIDVDMKSRLTRYNSFFGPHLGEHEIPLKTFRKRARTLLDSFEKWRRRNDEEKERYISYFSSERWNSLPAAERQHHSARNCRACTFYHEAIHSTFPTSKMRHSGKADSPIKTSKKVSTSLPKPSEKPTKRALVDTTAAVYNTINKPFKELYGVDFSEAQTQVPGLNLQTKLSKQEKRKSTNDIRRQDRDKLTELLAETEADAVLSTRQSLSQRDKKRKIQFFESRDEAEGRAAKRKQMESSGDRTKKRHSPQPATIDFDKEGLLAEVRNMHDGDQVHKHVKICIHYLLITTLIIFFEHIVLLKISILIGSCSCIMGHTLACTHQQNFKGLWLLAIYSGRISTCKKEEHIYNSKTGRPFWCNGFFSCFLHFTNRLLIPFTPIQF